MDNHQIEQYVHAIVEALVKNATKVQKPEDKIMIEAGVALAVNFLQNLNDIAECSRVFTEKETR